ncbi:MAG: diacylglycerol O-acyltransferase / wax synthase [Frankiales bacterium]|nr:diacylglycerol O-acyltransferase / wax synthase [Frankiales bacterium]
MSLLATLVTPADAAFLLPETREQPMHVGSLQLFRPPAGSGVHDLSGIYAAAVATPEIAPLFRKRLTRGFGTLGQWAWEDDASIDLEHHVRHSSLPKPGRMRELLALCGRLHSTLLDRQRPLWEMHLIEGLEDGRFAVYTKIHHSLLDGVSGLRLLERSLSTDPDARDTGMPFAARPQDARRVGLDLGGLLSAGLHAAVDAVTLAPKVVSLIEQGIRHEGAVLPGQAPRSILNVPITGSRRFAGDAWELDRIRTVAKKADATINDVVLAMSAAALRDYLSGLDALPDDSLIAMTPVSLRGESSTDGGNAVGAILCSLGTHLIDPEERLLHIRDSTRRAKASLAGLSQLQVTALSAGIMSPLVLNTIFGVPPLLRPPFNLIISNVPGPRHPLYWNGARLDGMYPLSIPTTGQALNITCTSYDTQLQFGLTGCRRTLPHLQSMLGGLDDGLAALEKAFG